MKQQVIVLVLCAFVIQILGNETKKHHLRQSRQQTRQNDGVCQCPCSCDSPGAEPNRTESNTTIEENTTQSYYVTYGASNSTSNTSIEPDYTTTTPVINEQSTTQFGNSTETNKNSTEPGTSSSNTNSDNGTTISTGESTNSTGTTTLSGDVTLRIYIRANASLLAVFSVQLRGAYILDLNNQLAAFFCSESGTVVILNYETRVGYYVSGRSDISWNPRQTTWDQFFARLNLRILFRYIQGRGEKLSPGNVSQQLSNELILAFRALGVTITDGNAALNFWIQISIRWAATFQGNLRGLLQIIETRVVEFRGNILKIVATFQGLAEFFSRINGGIRILIQRGIRLSLERLLQARSSVEIFIYIVRVLRQYNVNIREIIGTYGNIFELIASISGSSLQGVNGVFTVIGRVVGVAQGHLEVRVLILALIEYYQSNRSLISIEEIRQYLINLRDFLHSIRLPEVAQAIDRLLNRRFIINGIQIHSVIEILVQRSDVPLHNIVRILVLLQEVIRIETSTGELFLTLIYIAAQDNGSIIIGVLLNTEIRISGNLLVYIAGQFSINDLRSRNVTLVLDALARIEITRKIISAFNDGLGQCSHLDVEGLLKHREFQGYIIRIIVILIQVRTTGSVNGIPQPGANNGSNVDDGDDRIKYANKHKHKRRHHIHDHTNEKSQHLEEKHQGHKKHEDKHSFSHQYDKHHGNTRRYKHEKQSSTV